MGHVTIGKTPTEMRRYFLYVIYQTLGFREEIERLQPDFVSWLRESNTQRKEYPPASLVSLFIENKGRIIEQLDEAGIVVTKGREIFLTDFGKKILGEFKVEMPIPEISASLRSMSLVGQEILLALVIKYPGITSREINPKLAGENVIVYSLKLSKRKHLLRFNFGGPQRLFLLFPTFAGVQYYEHNVKVSGQ